MKHGCSFVLVALLACAVVTPGWTKGQTVGIDIRGDFLASPIVITDPQILTEFSICNA